MSKAALSNLMGSIGYSYGSSKVGVVQQPLGLEGLIPLKFFILIFWPLCLIIVCHWDPSEIA